MTGEKQITILNIPEETKVAAGVLMRKANSPFISFEDCIASLIVYRMQLKALGETEKVKRIDNTYHLANISVIYKTVTAGE